MWSALPCYVNDRDTILIPQRLCNGLEIGELIQYGDVAGVIVGAHGGYALARVVVLAPGQNPKRIDDGDTTLNQKRTQKAHSEILGDMPKGFVPMYGPLIVTTAKNNQGQAKVMVWQYAPVERFTEEFPSEREAEREAERILYVLQKHGVMASRPIGSKS